MKDEVYATLKSSQFKAAPRRVRLLRTRKPVVVRRWVRGPQDGETGATLELEYSTNNVQVEVFDRAGSKPVTTMWVHKSQLIPRKHNEDEIKAWFVLERLKGNS